MPTAINTGSMHICRATVFMVLISRAYLDLVEFSNFEQHAMPKLINKDANHILDGSKILHGD
jgi:hypothetical protein